MRSAGLPCEPLCHLLATPLPELWQVFLLSLFRASPDSNRCYLLVKNRAA